MLNEAYSTTAKMLKYDYCKDRCNIDACFGYRHCWKNKSADKINCVSLLVVAKHALNVDNVNYVGTVVGLLFFIFAILKIILSIVVIIERTLYFKNDEPDNGDNEDDDFLVKAKFVLSFVLLAGTLITSLKKCIQLCLCKYIKGKQLSSGSGDSQYCCKNCCSECWDKIKECLKLLIEIIIDLISTIVGETTWIYSLAFSIFEVCSAKSNFRQMYDSTEKIYVYADIILNISYACLVYAKRIVIMLMIIYYFTKVRDIQFSWKNMCKKSCKKAAVYIFLCFYMIGMSILHMLMIAAVGMRFNYEYSNKQNHQDIFDDDSIVTKFKVPRFNKVGMKDLSGQLWYMLVVTIIIPLASTVVFLMVTYMWVRNHAAFLIKDILTNVKNTEIKKVSEKAIEEYKEINEIYKSFENYEDKENRYQKCIHPFCNPLIYIICTFYFILYVSFYLCFAYGV